VLRLLPARSADQGIDYVNSLVEINLASRMAAGSVRSYQQAFHLHMMPVNLIGVAISTAFFPKMTESLSAGRINEYRDDVRTALRTIIWIAMPVAVVAFFARGYVVSFIINGGDAVIAGVLGALVLSLFARSVFHLVTRTFYARQDTRTPLIVSIVAISINITLAIVFSKVLGMGLYGLAYAQSIGAVLEVGILLALLNRREKGILNIDFWHAGTKMMIASGIAGLVAYTMTKLFPLRVIDVSFWATFPRFFLIATVSLGVYVLVSWVLRLEEVRPVLKKVKEVLGGKKK